LPTSVRIRKIAHHAMVGIVPAMAVLVGVSLGGCTATVTTEKKISPASLEQSAIEALAQQVGQRPDALRCPSELTAKVGESTRCELTDGDVRLGVTVTVKSVDDAGNAKYDITVDDKPLP
jgi:hypothetical protein